MSLTLRLIPLAIAALLLAGCAEGGSFGALSSGGSGPRPKTVAVSDFVFGDGVVAIDRGFTARLERKVGGFPTHERKQRTNERVNDEIVAYTVALLREAGLDAQPGNEDTLALKDDAVVVSGRLRPVDPVAAKKDLVGFGSGRGGVVAEMTLMRGKRTLLSFSADGGKRSGAPAGIKQVASRNAAIAESLTTSMAHAEKLSPDVESQARNLGRGIADKVLGFAKEQGWLIKAEGAEVTPEAELRVKLPEPKPAGRRPTKPADPEAVEKPDG